MDAIIGVMLFTKARLPVEPAIRDWIEKEWAWLTDNLGITEFRAIEPSDEYFPDRWDGTPEAANKLFLRVVDYAGVAGDRVELGLVPPQEEAPPALIQQGERYLLPLEASELRNPTVTVAILARKLALIRLKDAGVDFDRDDLPLLADLACVVLGLGIFNANAAVPEVPR